MNLPEGAHIYVFGTRDGPYKIGYTTKLGKRKIGLFATQRKDGASEEADYLHFRPCFSKKSAKQAEALAHKLLAEFRIKRGYLRTEWFTCDLDTAIKTVNSIKVTVDRDMLKELARL